MTKQGEWSPDSEKALKALIRATISNAGPIAPDLMPHKIKAALKEHATGGVDLDDLIKQVIKEIGAE